MLLELERYLKSKLDEERAKDPSLPTMLTPSWIADFVKDNIEKDATLKGLLQQDLAKTSNSFSPKSTDEISKMLDNINILPKDKKDKLLAKDFKKDISEQARLATQLECFNDPDYFAMSDADKLRAFEDNFNTAVENCLVSAVINQKSATSRGAPITHAQAKALLQSAAKVDLKPEFAYGSLAAIQAYNEKTAKKTGLKGFIQKAKSLDEGLTKKYGAKYTIARNIAITGAIGLSAGPAGLAAYSCVKTYNAFKSLHTQYKEDKKAGKTTAKHFGAYLNENKSERNKAMIAGASSILSVVSAGSLPLEETLGFLDNLSSAVGGNEVASSLGVDMKDNALGMDTSSVSKWWKRGAKAVVAVASGVNEWKTLQLKAFRSNNAIEKKQLRSQARKAGIVAFATAGAALVGQELLETELAENIKENVASVASSAAKAASNAFEESSDTVVIQDKEGNYISVERGEGLDISGAKTPEEHLAALREAELKDTAIIKDANGNYISVSRDQVPEGTQMFTKDEYQKLMQEAKINEIPEVSDLQSKRFFDALNNKAKVVFDSHGFSAEKMASLGFDTNSDGFISSREQMLAYQSDKLPVELRIALNKSILENINENGSLLDPKDQAFYKDLALKAQEKQIEEDILNNKQSLSPELDTPIKGVDIPKAPPVDLDLDHLSPAVPQQEGDILSEMQQGQTITGNKAVDRHISRVTDAQNDVENAQDGSKEEEKAQKRLKRREEALKRVSARELAQNNSVIKEADDLYLESQEVTAENSRIQAAQNRLGVKNTTTPSTPVAPVIDKGNEM